jgi:predicted transposase/invertase (TIGR01784 family)
MSMKIGIKAWVDFAFKKIFGKPGNEICLISLLNAILDLPVQITSVEFLNPFSFQEFLEDKLICVDVKATDQNQRVFVVEVQMVVPASFGKRAVYYACRSYQDQLSIGCGYADLKATYSVCILMRDLWKDSGAQNTQIHHRFRLVDEFSGRTIPDTIEIHTVELSKYNGSVETVQHASPLEQWCYWIKNSNDHTLDELRSLLPDLAFLRATNELKAIQEIAEERTMYDTREKAIRDHDSNLIDARREGKLEGEIQGEIKGEIRLIRTLEELLGTPPADESRLQCMQLAELQSLTSQLRSMLRSRNA